jgi:hypothetical protein
MFKLILAAACNIVTYPSVGMKGGTLRSVAGTLEKHTKEDSSLV